MSASNFTGGLDAQAFQKASSGVWHPQGGGWIELSNNPEERRLQIAKIPADARVDVMTVEDRASRAWYSCPRVAESWDFGAGEWGEHTIAAYKVVGDAGVAAKEDIQAEPTTMPAVASDGVKGLEYPPIDASLIADRLTIDGVDALAYATTATVGLGWPMIMGVDPATGPDKTVMHVEIPPGYDKLFAVLVQAFDQAAGGKGKERHARTGVAFQDQPMALINKQIGSIDGFIYQAHKKSLEAIRLPDGRAQAEILGAINYLAGAVIALDTWANKSSSKD